MFQENVLKFMHPKTDIFSFGAMISEIIFEKRIIEFKRINLTPYVKKLQSKTYKIFVVDRYYDKSGIKHLMLILKILMLMCVHPEPEKRPDIDWIIVILRVITNIIETNYWILVVYLLSQILSACQAHNKWTIIREPGMFQTSLIFFFSAIFFNVFHIYFLFDALRKKEKEKNPLCLVFPYSFFRPIKFSSCEIENKSYHTYVDCFLFSS